ncbi:29536_t:CDS:2, partial [Gigaspora margarita]
TTTETLKSVTIEFKAVEEYILRMLKLHQSINISLGKYQKENYSQLSLSGVYLNYLLQTITAIVEVNGEDIWVPIK